MELDEKTADILLSSQLGREVLEDVQAGKITVDSRGHWKGRPYAFGHENEDLLFMFCGPALGGECRRIVEARKNGVPADPPMKLSSCFVQCFECSRDVEFYFDGFKFVAAEECPYPNGMPPIDIELNIPSGKMVVANDLRDLFPVIGGYNVNYTEGIRQTIVQYAEAGLAHGFVGNTCPSVFQYTDGFNFSIGTQGYIEGTEDNDWEDTPVPLEGKEAVAGICTDLWWYSICDYDEFVKRAGCEPGEGECDVVECLPGVYKFSNRYHMVDEKPYGDPKTYVEIEWVRNPDPVKNYRSKYDSLNFTAGQILLNKIRCWPTLYGTLNGDPDNDMECFVKAADHLMVTIGNGCEFHPNGWFGDDPDLDIDAEDADVPEFHGQHPWYPLSDCSNLANVCGVYSDWEDDQGVLPVNDSFLALAFNILRCMVEYGYKDNGRDTSAAENGASKKKATELLEKLTTLYPDKVPERVRKLLGVQA